MFQPKPFIKTTILYFLILFTFIFYACNYQENLADKKQNTTTTLSKDSNAKTEKPFVDSNILKFKRKTFTYDSTKTYIYLTFDDGPSYGTETCYNICKNENIKATFFMIGRNATNKVGKYLAQKIKNDYPQILLANHSYTHTNERYKYFYEHPAIAEQDFYKAQDTLSVPFKIIRLPGNSAWVDKNGIRKSSNLVKSVCKKLDSAGYNVMGWDVEWHFTRGESYPVQTPEKLAAEVNYAARGYSHTPNHVVILTHDRMFRTPAFSDSLIKFIKIIKSNPNYVFETIDNYPNLKFD
ncbi:MAG: polysaccharide deacetylase family protein [Chitinophagales bacterium]|nr:polysaccharide deacetylase family protein [Chitinophagaceae bacterium]MCZ2299560.1 polysaccharide deacetylase family protein [Chitinophagales bacterium]